MKIEMKSQNVMRIVNSRIWVVIFGVIFLLVGVWIVINSLPALSITFWFGIVFLISGVFVPLCSKYVIITLDKDSRHITSRKKLPFRRTVTSDYLIADLKEVQLRPVEYFDPGDRITYGYFYFLIFHDGKEINLTGGEIATFAKFIFDAQLEKCRKTAKRIADFVNIPVVEKEIERYGIKEIICDSKKNS